MKRATYNTLIRLAVLSGVFVSLAVSIPVSGQAPKAVGLSTPDGNPTPLTFDLWNLRKMRKGPQTEYGSVDERVAELIARYPAPADQGKIYLEALLVHALSGLTFPDRAEEYAAKAEPLLQAPQDRAQLYLSWGNAVQMKHAGATGRRLEAGRKEATDKYLQGMKVAVDLDLPKTLPPRPEQDNALFLSDDILDGGQNIEGLVPGEVDRVRRMPREQRQQLRDAHHEAVKTWDIAREVLPRTQYSRDLIIDLYSKVPFNTPELRDLAEATLENGDAVQDLVQRVEARLATNLKKAGFKAPDRLPRDLLDASAPLAIGLPTTTPVADAAPPQVAAGAAAAPPPGEAGPSAPPARRRWVIVLAAVMLLGAILGVALWAVQNRQRGAIKGVDR